MCRNEKKEREHAKGKGGGARERRMEVGMEGRREGGRRGCGVLVLVAKK